MRRFVRTVLAAAIGLCGLIGATNAHASLNVFQTFNGSYGLSTSGGGSANSSYGISAFVPAGATVAGAYIYQTNRVDSTSPYGVSLNGSVLTFNNFSVNSAASYLSSARADVTSILAPIINSGPGGTYNFNVIEASPDATDGTALVVVYSLASLPNQTVAILDGFAATTGDSTSLNFADPIDPTTPDFTAEMRLGIGFGFQAGDPPAQASTVKVNGTTITDVAGNYDDGQAANGALITVGGNNDPFTPNNPTSLTDHERYNIAGYIKKGDTSIKVDTLNPSGDDNVFLATFVVSGNAGVNTPPPPPTSGVPEPDTWALMLVGFGAIGVFTRRGRKDKIPALAAI